MKKGKILTEGHYIEIYGNVKYGIRVKLVFLSLWFLKPCVINLYNKTASGCNAFMTIQYHSRQLINYSELLPSPTCCLVVQPICLAASMPVLYIRKHYRIFR